MHHFQNARGQQINIRGQPSDLPHPPTHPPSKPTPLITVNHEGGVPQKSSESKKVLEWSLLLVCQKKFKPSLGLDLIESQSSFISASCNNDNLCCSLSANGKIHFSPRLLNSFLSSQSLRESYPVNKYQSSVQYSPWQR